MIGAVRQSTTAAGSDQIVRRVGGIDASSSNLSGRPVVGDDRVVKLELSGNRFIRINTGAAVCGVVSDRGVSNNVGGSVEIADGIKSTTFSRRTGNAVA